MKALIVAAIVVGSVAVAHAHPLDLGYLVVDTRGPDIAIELDFDRNIADKLGTPEAAYRPATPSTPNGACRWLAGATQLRGRTFHLTDRLRCPAGTIRWTLPLATTNQVLVKIVGASGERVAIIDRAHPDIELTTSTALRFRDFVWTGVEHIGAATSEWRDACGWKLPDGIDHIVFLIALVLAGGTLLELLAVASGFTLGHTISLAIATFGIARPPSSVIEPLIALTIIIAALEAYRGSRQRKRWLIAAGFGLVHGFAFATALAELDLHGGRMAVALVGYNLGVELGQIAIVLLTAPLLLWLRRRCPGPHALITRVVAASIAIAGLYWFVTRL